MIDSRVLRLTPKRFFCPICGKWHDWEGKSLQLFDEDDPYEYTCNDCSISFWVKDNQICVSSDDLCDPINNCLEDSVALDDINYDDSEPVIKFSIPIETDEIICSDECNCSECDYHYHCNLVNIGDERGNDDDEFSLNLEFKFEFARRYFDKYYKEFQKEQLQKSQTHENRLQSQQIKELSQQTAEKNTPKTIEKTKEATTMANPFNMNMEFGPNTDTNIASTFMGIAVKNGESWRIYDKKKKEITDIGDIKLGNLPIFIMPTTKLEEGDLIKDNGEYYFVIKVNQDSTQTLSAKTGELKNIIPIKNILGFSCYSKLVYLSDSLNLDEGLDFEKIAIMSAMSNQPDANGISSNNPINQMLPLMLFKDKLGSSNESMTQKLLWYSMIYPNAANSATPNAPMNQMLPLLLMDKKDTSDDKMTNLLLAYSMSDPNAAGGNNMLINYWMLDTFMNTKKEKKDDKSADADSNPD